MTQNLYNRYALCSVLYVDKNAHKVAITYCQQLFPFLFGNENYNYVVKNPVNTVMLKKTGQTPILVLMVPTKTVKKHYLLSHAMQIYSI